MGNFLTTEINIYCDGACKGNPGIGGWGSYIEINNYWNTKEDKSTDKFTYELYGEEQNTTNNVMEMTALIKSVEWLVLNHYDKNKVNFYIDSAYIINCYKEKWYNKWLQNEWLTSKKQPVKNKDLWEKIIVIFNQPNFHFMKVEGHSGIKGNEIADKLANEGVKYAK